MSLPRPFIRKNEYLPPRLCVVGAAMASGSSVTSVSSVVKGRHSHFPDVLLQLQLHLVQPAIDAIRLA